MAWNELYDKFFPKISRKSLIFSNILLILKTTFVMFDTWCDKRLNRDI